MPLTPDMRRSIDQIRDYLYGGGYPDPVSNAEQLSFLFFFYLVEGIDAENALKAKVTKQSYESLFAGEWTLRNPLNAATPDEKRIPRERFRWSVWAKALSGETLVRYVRDEVFAFFAELGERTAHNFMNGARLHVDKFRVRRHQISVRRQFQVFAHLRARHVQHRRFHRSHRSAAATHIENCRSPAPHHRRARTCQLMQGNSR